jgi:HSP20 family protein
MTLLKYGRRPAAWGNYFDSPLMRDLFAQTLGSDSTPTAPYVASPKVNIRENEQQYTIDLLAPGRSREELKVQVEGNQLLLSYEQSTKEASVLGDTIRRTEFGHGSFKRAFTLPESVQADGINATYTNGILTITLPKHAPAPEQTPRTISIA